MPLRGRTALDAASLRARGPANQLHHPAPPRCARRVSAVAAVAVPRRAWPPAAVSAGLPRRRRQGFVFKAALKGRTPAPYPPFIFLLL